MNNVKFGWNQYFKPTPKNLRKIGDAVIVLGSAITTAAGLAGPKWLIIAGGIFTVLGKVMTNFFSDR